MSITIHYTIEPEYADTVWCRETLSGIAAKASSLRYDKLAHDEKTLCDIPCGESLIVIGTSPQWVSHILTAANNLALKTVAVSCHPLDTTARSSFVLIDHNGATRECLEYLRAAGKTRTAIFGINSNINSYADTIKTRYFSENDIFHIKSDGGIDRCFREFCEKLGSYDSVVCSNYISAVYLMTGLKKCGVRVPEDIFVMTYGDSVLGKLMSPSLTTITLDHEQLGVQAVNLCRFPFFAAEKNISITVYVPCRIVAADSTANLPYAAGSHNAVRLDDNECADFKDAANIFALDPKILEVQAFEKLLRLCDSCDFEIISLLLDGNSYARIAEKLYMSDSTVKYRIKRLVTGSGVESGSEMLRLYTEYIGMRDKK